MSRQSLKLNLKRIVQNESDLSDQEKADILREVASQLGSYTANEGGEFTVATGSDSAKRQF